MKLSKILPAACAALLGITALHAQTPSSGDVLQLSQQNFSFNTARVSALGGAFTSLGADLSSMAINPAGLGMYRGSDFGFSPIVSISNTETNFGGNSYSASKTQFSVGNLAAAFNLYQGSGTLTSFTLGVGYNRLADFNSSSYTARMGIDNSFSELLGERIYGAAPSELGSSAHPFDYRSIYQWGGILGYQSWALEPVPGTNPQQYSPLGPDAYSPDRVGPLSVNATMNPQSWIQTRGSVGEYAFSGGVNLNNKFYIGLTLGLQDYYYYSENHYQETYNNNDANLNYLGYNRAHRLSGTGFNIKVGVIARPTPNLRIGVAVHTPTWVSMEEEYQEYMAATYNGESYNDVIYTPLAVNRYDITTPTRLMGGISYTFPGIGLITADYERAWYNGMRLKNTGDMYGVESGFKDDVTNYFRAANNFRAGLELTPTDKFFLRAGYAYYGSCIKEKDYLIYANGNLDSDYIDVASKHPDVDSYYNISGGLGFRFGSFYTDLTYVYTQYKYLDSPLFYFEDRTDGYIIGSGKNLYDNPYDADVQYKQKRHTIILSLGVKF